jgi:hypothetical protein
MSIFVGWVAIGTIEEIKKGASPRFQRLAPTLLTTIRWVLPPVILFAAVYAFISVGQTWIAEFGGGG